MNNKFKRQGHEIVLSNLSIDNVKALLNYDKNAKGVYPPDCFISELARDIEKVITLQEEVWQAYGLLSRIDDQLSKKTERFIQNYEMKNKLRDEE